MKKLTFLLIALSIPAFSLASVSTNPWDKANALPTTSFEHEGPMKAATFEWECRISEVINATSAEEAVTEASQACVEQTREAAVKDPSIYKVIDISVAATSLSVNKGLQGYVLEGTLILDSLIFER